MGDCINWPKSQTERKPSVNNSHTLYGRQTNTPCVEQRDYQVSSDSQISADCSPNTHNTLHMWVLIAFWNHNYKPKLPEYLSLLKNYDVYSSSPSDNTERRGKNRNIKKKKRISMRTKMWASKTQRKRDKKTTNLNWDKLSTVFFKYLRTEGSHLTNCYPVASHMFPGSPSCAKWAWKWDWKICFTVRLMMFSLCTFYMYFGMIQINGSN